MAAVKGVAGCTERHMEKRSDGGASSEIGFLICLASHQGHRSPPMMISTSMDFWLHEHT